MYAFAPHSMDRRTRAPFRRIRLPSARLEYAYYFAVVYSVMAPALGLEIPVLAGLLILAVWFFCVFRVQSAVKEVFGPIALLLACGISVIVVQVGIHGQSILDSDIRAFMTWIMGLMIVQTLVLRLGFSIRFPVVLFLIGAVTLPFVGYNAGVVEMARVDIAVQGGLTHPAGFAEWFGFAAIFFAIFGIESRRPPFKIGAWGLMLICLFLVTLSVQRVPLFATALGLILAFRKLLKRGFVPLLMVTLFAGVISFTGVFERAISSYSERGLEDTGREILWPGAIERIWDAPILGEGISNAVIQLSRTKFSPPHNSFLYFALSSGIVPLLFFATFWLRVSWRTVFQSSVHKTDPFSLPYLGFILPSLMFGDLGFLSMGGLMITSLVANASIARRPQFAVSPVRSNRARRQGYNQRPITASRVSQRERLYGFISDRTQF
jgi:O-antigen ligase